MTKRSSLYFGLADVDVQPNFKFSQVRAETNQITCSNSQSDNLICALGIDKDEEIMDNSECPENQDLPVESSNKIIRLSSFELAFGFSKIVLKDPQTVVYTKSVDF